MREIGSFEAKNRLSALLDQVALNAMRDRRILTASLPREMMEQVEATRKAEHRTRSELVREALRTYMALARHFPEAEAIPAEIRALARARLEFERGETISLTS